ncbi:hypothetical protein VIGAN_08215300 [Vigna angularis var. angularis]|uniref:Uncharacterized protein n=1 Tax=Vigna angularis var. angularis TaxID=157739 RepID=A0A0S3SRH9_PHAAN|nr:hypothetical protein VIGAN_08215300 [Vigna angularis var. angularis]
MWLLDCFEREDVACWMVQLLHVPSLFFPWTFPLDIAAAMPFTETVSSSSCCTVYTKALLTIKIALLLSGRE